MPTSALPAPGAAPTSRRTRRVGRVIATSATAALAIAAVGVAGAGPASAAEPVRAQAVGTFLDGTVGSAPIQQLADLEDARATAPGPGSVQNPLDVTALQSINLPLTGALQLDELFETIHAGAVNQVAVAKKDGYSYGASGAVSNQGGVSVGGSSGVPDAAVIKLGPGSLSGALGSALDRLGSITLHVGAVSALAQTKAGGATVTPKYHIAGLRLEIGSSALAGVLQPLDDALDGLLRPLQDALGALGGSAPSCSLTDGLDTLTLAGGAVVLDPADGGLVIDLQSLLNELGLDLNSLPANTDLIDVLLHYLTSPDGLVAGLTTVLHSVVDPLQRCVGGLGQFSDLLDTLLGTVSSAANELTGTLADVLDDLAPGSADYPLAPLADVLKQLVDIGVNVQSGPGAGPSNTTFPFTSQLAATPNQSTPVVENQTLVRAIEVNLVGDPLATIALANAAAGPSSAAPPSTPSSSTPAAPDPTPTNSPEAPNTPAAPNGSGTIELPTGVPAGMATHGGSSTLPLVLLIVGIVFAGSGAVAWSVRTRRGH